MLATNLDDAAVSPVTRWLFAPAREGREAVERWVEVPLKFAAARQMIQRAALPLVVLVGTSPAAARQLDDPTRLEPGVISVTRMEQKADDARASVTVLGRDDIRASASQTVDDLLRQVPGFSLFRRTSSGVGHPTTQGLSLRGIGKSGTSRALVLVDGVPGLRLSF